MRNISLAMILLMSCNIQINASWWKDLHEWPQEKKNAQLGYSTLQADACNTQAVEYLLHAGAQVTRQDQYGNTPLDSAVVFSNQDVVKLLLDHGANVNHQSQARCPTPLHKAVNGKKVALVCLLLQHGARIDILDNQGRTAYDLAKHMIAWRCSGAIGSIQIYHALKKHYEENLALKADIIDRVEQLSINVEKEESVASENSDWIVIDDEWIFVEEVGIVH